MDNGNIDYTKVIYKTPKKNATPSPKKKGMETQARFHGNIKNDGLTGEFSGMNYPHTREMLKVIDQMFYNLNHSTVDYFDYIFITGFMFLKY